MSVKALLGWLGCFRAEPWREEAAGRRLGRFARATHDLQGAVEDDFVIQDVLTAAEAKRQDDLDCQASDFDAWQRQVRITAADRKRKKG